MATNIDGLAGFNKSDGTNKLIAAYGNDLVDVDAGTGYGQNISFGNRAEFEQFLDNLFFQNYVNTPKNFNGTSWVRSNTAHVPLAKYIKRWKTRLYLGYVKILDTAYPSRIWHSDLPKNDTIQWGFMSGTNLVTTLGTNLVTAANAGFKTYGVKVGDPFFITTGSDIGEYTILEVGEQFVRLIENLRVTATGVSYWCGSNKFDINTDDGDVATGFGENSDRLLIFKNNSLHRYDGSSRSQIKGVPGTTSQRSVQNVKDVFTIYFHGSLGNRTGFYMYDGVTATKISNAIEKHIAGIAAANFDDVVAWTEGNLYRAYVGTITNANHGISTANAVLTFDVETGVWSVDPIGKTILASTRLRESNQLNSYLGDNDASVFQAGLPTVYAHDTAEIPFVVETRVVYPEGSEQINNFTRVQAVARNATGVKLEYKLYNQPEKVDDKWTPLGEVYADKSEFSFPRNNSRGSGYQYRLSQSSSREPDMLIEKISTFYQPEFIPKSRSERV